MNEKGYCLAQGSVRSIKVPAAMVNLDFRILVGAHTFPITDTITQIANPFGEGIYIFTPYEADLGIVGVQLTNIVPAPFFSAKTISQTSLQESIEEQRHHRAPWADFESDKYRMQVPASRIYNDDDPVTLMQACLQVCYM